MASFFPGIWAPVFWNPATARGMESPMALLCFLSSNLNSSCVECQGVSKCSPTGVQQKGVVLAQYTSLWHIVSVKRIHCFHLTCSLQRPILSNGIFIHIVPLTSMWNCTANEIVPKIAVSSRTGCITLRQHHPTHHSSLPCCFCWNDFVPSSGWHSVPFFFVGGCSLTSPAVLEQNFPMTLLQRFDLPCLGLRSWPARDWW